MKGTQMTVSAVRLYFLSFALAACSLLYELLAAYTISDLAHHTVLWYSLTVGVYLGAMGIGAVLCSVLFRRMKSWDALYWVEILLSLMGGLAVSVIYFDFVLLGHLEYQIGYPAAIRIFFGVILSVIVGIGILTGMELPLLIRLGKELVAERPVTNRVLGADYFGALAAGLIFPLVLVPRLDSISIGLVTALFNLLCAFLILQACGWKGGRTVLKAGIAVLLVGGSAAGLARAQDVQQFFLKKNYYYLSSPRFWDIFDPHDDLPDVQRFSSAYQKIDYVTYPFYLDPVSPLLNDTYSGKLVEQADYPRLNKLYLNDMEQFVSDSEEFYHEHFAHVPIIAAGKVPENVLVLGGGDGLLIFELLKYPGIRKITLVELDPAMVEFAKEFPPMRRMNGDALRDPRVEVVVADAYQFVRREKETYDAIYMDFPLPVDYNLSKLHSREFLEFVGRRLKDSGFVVFNTLGTSFFSDRDKEGKRHMAPENTWSKYYQTVRAAGYKTIVPYAINIDIDDPDAVSALAELFTDGQINLNGCNPAMESCPLPEPLYRQIDARLQNYAARIRDGFILAKKEAGGFPMKYHPFPVKMYVINERSFRLAFELPYAPPGPPDRSQVNSIMRPTLLDPSEFWHIER